MMDLVYAFAHDFPIIALLASWMLPMALVLMAAAVSGRSLLSAYALVGVAVLMFIALFRASLPDHNPYDLAEDASPSRMARLAELRREYPSIDPLMRRAAADRRITNAEFLELTEGEAAIAAMIADGQAQDRLNRQAVIDGIPPVEPKTGVKRP
jgi:hypothetical protein